MPTTPPSLRPGDRVAIVCPARKVSHAEVAASVAILTSWGLEVVLGDTVTAEHHQFAGPDELRRADFQRKYDRLRADWQSRTSRYSIRQLRFPRVQHRFQQSVRALLGRPGTGSLSKLRKHRLLLLRILLVPRYRLRWQTRKCILLQE